MPSTWLVTEYNRAIWAKMTGTLHEPLDRGIPEEMKTGLVAHYLLVNRIGLYAT